MNADVAFKIGKGHKVCQDYARCDPSGRWALVSDGCSSSEDSDIGARLLFLCAQNMLKVGHPAEAGIVQAHALARGLDLPEQCLDATLLVARYNDDRRGVEVSMYGDGIVVAVDRHRGIKVYDVSYPSGYPQYLSYSVNPKRNALLGDNECHLTYADGKNIATDKACKGNFFFESSFYGMVAMFSDGVKSFSDKNGTDISWRTVIDELTDIPSTKGEFVQRQLNWMEKEYTKRGLFHGDDITMACIVM